jgi:hypothetical protein
VKESPSPCSTPQKTPKFDLIKKINELQEEIKKDDMEKESLLEKAKELEDLVKKFEETTFDRSNEPFPAFSPPISPSTSRMNIKFPEESVRFTKLAKSYNAFNEKTSSPHKVYLRSRTPQRFV